MKFLISGGLGFVGGRIAKHLSRKEHDVIVATRSEQKIRTALYQRNIQIDWLNQKKLEYLCEGVDVVIHCAGLNAKECEADRDLAFEVNAKNTQKLLRAANKANCKKFILISTIHVYSSTLSGAFSETSPLLNKHPYGWSKGLGEKLCQETDRTQVLILRLSNAFGRPASRDTECWHLFVNDLCRQAGQISQAGIDFSFLGTTRLYILTSARKGC